MLIVHIILAATVVVALALGPGGTAGAAVAVAAAGVDIALGAGVGSTAGEVAPVVVFLAVALTLAAAMERAGLAERAAAALARRAGGDSRRLYLYVCLMCAALTATVSLDGAVVLMVPLLLALRRRGAPFGPLFLGTVAVANAFSIAVPEGNPTNLLIIAHLHLAPTAFLSHMFVPGILATLLCAAAVAACEWRRLAAPYPTHPPPASGRPAPRAREPRCRLTAVAPWRTGVQIASAVLVVHSLGPPHFAPPGAALPALLFIAAGTGAAAAFLNNLPVTASALTLITAAPAGYAACVGLAVGSLATPRGSLATLLAGELAGPGAPRPRARRFAPLAAVAVLVATLALWPTL